MTDSLNPADWFEKSKLNLEAAEMLLQNGPVALHSICFFHLQQTVEMLLKGKTMELGVRVRRTHDIELLQNDLNALGKANGIAYLQISDPATLSEVYMDGRYAAISYTPPTETQIRAVIAEIKLQGHDLAPAHFPKP